MADFEDSAKRSPKDSKRLIKDNVKLWLTFSGKRVKCNLILFTGLWKAEKNTWQKSRGFEGRTGMDRLFAAVSMQGNQSWHPEQDAGFFAVESAMNSAMPSFASILNTDTGKVPPNLKYH